MENSPSPSSSKISPPDTGWAEKNREILCQTPFLSVSRADFVSPMRPDGRPWIVVHRKKAVVVIPKTPDGKFVLIRQERPPVQAVICEFPAGQVDAEVSEEELFATARRELREETGMASPKELVKLGSVHSSPGFTDEHQTIFLAEEVVVVDEVPEGDPENSDEAIEGMEWLSSDELTAWVRAGKIHDANSMAAYALLAAHGKL